MSKSTELIKNHTVKDHAIHHFLKVMGIADFKTY